MATLYVVSDDTLTPRQMVDALDKRQLDDVITGRTRLGGDRSLDLAIWNAAIDRDNGY